MSDKTFTKEFMNTCSLGDLLQLGVSLKQYPEDESYLKQVNEEIQRRLKAGGPNLDVRAK